MSMFDNWLHDVESREAFKAGRAYQREVDARISENLFAGISKYIKDNDAGFDIATAIREQKIDD